MSSNVSTNAVNATIGRISNNNNNNTLLHHHHQQQQQQQQYSDAAHLIVQNETTKHCWVCFANEDDDYSAQWVSPCKCRGTAKWVHKACLQRWIDEKQQGNSTFEVACPQCNQQYQIVYPKCGLFVRILDFIDRIICKVCPFFAGSILVGSVYWTAVTYGAVTIMQVLGHKEGLNVMEKADPLIMLIGLPAIPMMLMLGRLIRWEDAVLKFWRKHSTKLPLLNLIFPNNEGQYLPRTPAAAYASNSDPISFTRTVCGGLILPTIATIFGKLMFQRVNSNFQRSIIGGIAFVGLKGIFKIYYKQQQFLRQAHRQIKNFESSSSSSSSSSPSAASSAIQSPHNQHNATPTTNNNNLNNNPINLTRRTRPDLFNNNDNNNQQQQQFSSSSATVLNNAQDVSPSTSSGNQNASSSSSSPIIENYDNTTTTNTTTTTTTTTTNLFRSASMLSSSSAESSSSSSSSVSSSNENINNINNISNSMSSV